MKFCLSVFFFTISFVLSAQNWQPVKHGLYNNVNHDSSFYIGQTLRITDTLDFAQNIYKLNMGVVNIKNTNGDKLIVRGFIGDSVQLANNFSILYRDSFLYRMPQTINVGDTVSNNLQDSSFVFLVSQQNQMVWDTVWQDVRTYVYSFGDTIWVTKNLGLQKVNLGGEKYFTVGTEGLLKTGRERFPDYGLLKDAELCLSWGDVNTGLMVGERFEGYLIVDSVTDSGALKIVHGLNYWVELGIMFPNIINHGWGDTSIFYSHHTKLKDGVFPNEAVDTLVGFNCNFSLIQKVNYIFHYENTPGQPFKLTAESFEQISDTLINTFPFMSLNYYPDLGLFDWSCSIFEFLSYNQIDGYSIDSLHLGYSSCSYLKCIGLEENKKEKIKIYPNPANKELRTSSALPLSNYSVLNEMGIIVLSGKISESGVMNTSGLTDGVYILQLEINGKSLRKVFLVQH